MVVESFLGSKTLWLQRSGDDEPIDPVQGPRGQHKEQADTQRDRKWKLQGECGRVFSRARRKDTTSTPAEAQGVNG